MKSILLLFTFLFALALPALAVDVPIKWPRQTDAAQYEVQKFDTASGTWNVAATVPQPSQTLGPDVKATIDLAAGTSTQVAIVAISTGGIKSARSPSTTFTVPNTPGAPSFDG